MISDGGVFYSSEFSPDGSRIVFIEYIGPQEKTGELYIANRMVPEKSCWMRGDLFYLRGE